MIACAPTVTWYYRNAQTIKNVCARNTQFPDSCTYHPTQQQRQQQQLQRQQWATAVILYGKHRIAVAPSATYYISSLPYTYNFRWDRVREKKTRIEPMLVVYREHCIDIVCCICCTQHCRPLFFLSRSNSFEAFFVSETLKGSSIYESRV